MKHKIQSRISPHKALRFKYDGGFKMPVISIESTLVTDVPDIDSTGLVQYLNRCIEGRIYNTLEMKGLEKPVLISTLGKKNKLKFIAKTFLHYPHDVKLEEFYLVLLKMTV